METVTIPGSDELWHVLGQQPEPDGSYMLYRRNSQGRLQVVQVAPHLVREVKVHELSP